MNKDEMNDDAEFEAFLKGEGDLAHQLQGLAQPSPSPSLDAAILGRIRTSMEQQRDVAANDAGQAQAGPRIAPVMGMRWRVPLGIAATVLVGLFATQAYRSDTSGDLVTMREQERAAEAVLEGEPVPAAEQAPPAAAEQAPPAPPALPEARIAALEAAAPAAAPAAPAPPAERARVAVREQGSAAASVEERRLEKAIAAPAPVAQAVPEMHRPAAPPPAAPAPASAAPAVAGLGPSPVAQPPSASAPARRETQEVMVSGSRIRSGVAEGASPVQVLADRKVEVSGSRIRKALTADPALDAAAWVQAIERMLDKGDVAGALREWKKLRETYPDFVPPKELEARMARLVELNS